MSLLMSFIGGGLALFVLMGLFGSAVWWVAGLGVVVWLGFKVWTSPPYIRRWSRR